MYLKSLRDAIIDQLIFDFNSGNEAIIKEWQQSTSIESVKKIIDEFGPMENLKENLLKYRAMEKAIK